MYSTAGLTVTPREVQTRQVGLRFTDREFRRLEKEARSRDLGKSTLCQLLIVEWLDSLGPDGE